MRDITERFPGGLTVVVCPNKVIIFPPSGLVEACSQN